MSSTAARKRHEHTVAVTRIFDAPRERVFAAAARGVQRLEETITVHLADEGGRTRLTLHAVAAGVGAEAAAMLRGMEQGWSETLDRLRERSNAIR
jgi:uncharacterized protein YndB with AHSA1/START domain